MEVGSQVGVECPQKHDSQDSDDLSNRSMLQESSGIPPPSAATPELRPIDLQELDAARMRDDINTRETTAMRHEVDTVLQENEILRSARAAEIQNFTARLAMRQSTVNDTESRVNVDATSDLLSYCNDSDNTYENWKNQILLLKSTYELDDAMTKILMDARPKATDSFYSPDNIGKTVADHLADLKRMLHRPSSVAARQHFEDRSWKSDEALDKYLPDKISLGSSISIGKKEMIDYLVKGIPEGALRDEARNRRFDSEDEVLDAFEKAKLSGTQPATSGAYLKYEEKSGAEKTSGTSVKFKEKSTTSDSSKEFEKKAHTKQTSGTGIKSGDKGANPKKGDAKIQPDDVRCKSCNGLGHSSKDCKHSRRSHDSCGVCGRAEHRTKDCPKKEKSKGTVRVTKTCKHTREEDEFQHNVEYVIHEGGIHYNLLLDTLLNSGSAVSFLKQKFVPREAIKEAADLSSRYSGINRSKLTVLGYINVSVLLDKRIKNDVSLLVVPDRTMCTSVLLGRDILRLFGYTLRAEHQRFVDGVRDILNIEICEVKDETADALLINDEIPLATRSVLKTMFKTNYLCCERPSVSKVKAELKLTLKDHQLFHYSPRHLTFTETNELQELLRNLEEKGTIRPSESEYASPILLVKKKSGVYRMCIDYSILNKHLASDNLPLPLIEDQLNVLNGKKYFSVFDLKDAFHHVRVAEDSIKYTSFITPLGQYEYLKMPFGLKTAPSVFQKIVKEVLKDLIEKRQVVTYMNDFLVATRTVEDHLRLLNEIFKRIVESDLELRLDKCKFMYTEIEYLGYLVSEKGIKPTKNGVEAVSNFPVPQTVRNVQSFLGMCSYFRKFIENYLVIAKPLYDLLHKDAKFVFGQKEYEVFDCLKNLLTESPILSIYSPLDETELHCDASALGFGAVLMQRKSDDKFHPIFYFSKRTTNVESRCNRFELETLAIIHALRRFRVYVQAVKFKIVTDCNSLALMLNSKIIHPCIADVAMELQNFDYTVEHRPGTKMTQVEGLRRAFEVPIVEDFSD